MPMLSLVIPTYNERSNILPLLENISKALKDRLHEVVIVDDNSPDETWLLVQEFSKQHPCVRLIRRMHERGLSSAVIAGFERARGDILGVMDADHSHDVCLLPKMIQLIENKEADCVIGSRRIAGGGADHWPWHRRCFSGLATFLAYLLTCVRVSDPLSGFFCVRRDAYENYKSLFRPKGYKILLEILVKAKPEKIIELPYVFVDRKQDHSKLSLGIAVAYFAQLIELLRVRLKMKNHGQ